MAVLRQQRCHNHLGREAVARCPSCGNFFCRECITEHDERILCAACLKRQTAPKERRRNRVPVGRMFGVLCGILAGWMYFYLIARVLVATPTKYHEGTVWRDAVEDEVEKQQSP